MPAAHMLNLARELELIMGEIHPQHTWIASIRQPDSDERPSATPVALRVDDAGAVPDDAHPALQRHDVPAPAGAGDEHDLDQAA